MLICQKKFEKKYVKDKKQLEVRDHCHYIKEYRDSGHSINKLIYSLPKKISIVFHNESKYHYHFITKSLAEEFAKKFTYLGESTEKCINLTVPIENEVTRFDKNGGKFTKTISYRLRTIDKARFVASS